MIKPLAYTLTVYHMSKRIESKDHTIRRLRGQRNILRRVAPAPVKEAQENNDRGTRNRRTRIVQDNFNDDGVELIKSSRFHEQQRCFTKDSSSHLGVATNQEARKAT